MTRDSPTRAFSIDIAVLFKQRHGGTAQKVRDESSLQKCFLRQGQFTRNSARARDGVVRVVSFPRPLLFTLREMKSARRKFFRL